MAPQYSATISLAVKSIKLSSMTAIKRCRATEDEMWPSRFPFAPLRARFGRALRTVKERVEEGGGPIYPLAAGGLNAQLSRTVGYPSIQKGEKTSGMGGRVGGVIQLPVAEILEEDFQVWAKSLIFGKMEFFAVIVLEFNSL